MGKGRGPAACCGCGCGICCAVFILLAGVITWACVWGIEYNPNVNVKTLDLDLREIRVNIYNRNLYVTDCVEIKISARAESSRRPPRHRRGACSTAWRCRFVPDTLVDFHTAGDRRRRGVRELLGERRAVVQVLDDVA